MSMVAAWPVSMYYKETLTPGKDAMYGKLNTILRSKIALWGIALFAIIMFCITATLAFGMHAGNRTADAPADKMPAIQPKTGGLHVQNSSADSSQLQGQEGNGAISQPAAPASSSSASELNAGANASSVQAGGAAVGPASTSLSASLQPSAHLGGSDGNGVNAQAGLNALGAGVNLDVKLP